MIDLNNERALGQAMDLNHCIEYLNRNTKVRGYFIIISNTVDMITYHVYKLSGLPRNHIIGTGTSVDSARLKNFIDELLHGRKSFLKVIEDNKDRVGSIDLDNLVLDTAKTGW